jgi:hypothetical protein
MPRVRFEPMTLVLEREKTSYVLDLAGHCDRYNVKAKIKYIYTLLTIHISCHHKHIPVSRTSMAVQ